MRMLIQLSFQPYFCFSNITKILRRTWNKIDATQVLSRNKIFRRREFFFCFKRDIEAKTRNNFRDFERDEIIKRQNNMTETKVRVTNKAFKQGLMIK